ncbi:hypothetical protein DY000_02040145 [Brassica cretica]|uniref:Uncharacterized protein n=1 Tax=Brassica cretica TaxID=69181 RepID=A0ABQ7B7T9_BRACR|nr:hypothetical protein DY000_02040145 [Brassica cretica]
MPPRTKQKSVKTPKITSENNVPPSNHNAPASYPWPREGQEGQPINIDDPILLDFNCEGWDKESAKRYNSLLHIEILPTRFDADMDDVEDITPDEDVAYDLGPLDDDADDLTYRRWMADFQRKNNSLMKGILKAITGGCFGGQDDRTSAQEQTPHQLH